MPDTHPTHANRSVCFFVFLKFLRHTQNEMLTQMTCGEKEGLGGGVIRDGRPGSQGMRVREGRGRSAATGAWGWEGPWQW